MSNSEQRKAELLESAMYGIRNYLESIRGGATFAGKPEIYPQAKQKHTMVIKTRDGEFYFIKIQKSTWEDKS